MTATGRPKSFLSALETAVADRCAVKLIAPNKNMACAGAPLEAHCISQDYVRISIGRLKKLCNKGV